MFNSADKLLVVIVCVVAGVAFVEPLFGEFSDVQGVLSVPSTLALMVLLFLWCKAHTKQSGVKEPTASATMCGFLSIVGVLIYFYRAFEPAEGSIKSLKAIAFTVLLGLADIAFREFGQYIAS